MVSKAAADIKQMFPSMAVTDLDIGKEINSAGNYLVFDGFIPDENLVMSGVASFTLFVAVKSLKRGNQTAYSLFDEMLEQISRSLEQDIASECKGIKLHSFSQRLFIYAVRIDIHGSWDGIDE